MLRVCVSCSIRAGSYKEILAVRPIHPSDCSLGREQEEWLNKAHDDEACDDGLHQSGQLSSVYIGKLLCKVGTYTCSYSVVFTLKASAR